MKRLAPLAVLVTLFALAVFSSPVGAAPAATTCGLVNLGVFKADGKAAMFIPPNTRPLVKVYRQPAARVTVVIKQGQKTYALTRLSTRAGYAYTTDTHRTVKPLPGGLYYLYATATMGSCTKTIRRGFAVR